MSRYTPSVRRPVERMELRYSPRHHIALDGAVRPVDRGVGTVVGPLGGAGVVQQGILRGGQLAHESLIQRFQRVDAVGAAGDILQVDGLPLGVVDGEQVDA